MMIIDVKYKQNDENTILRMFIMERMVGMMPSENICDIGIGKIFF